MLIPIQVDGPSEVHALQLGKNENKRFKECQDRLSMQSAKTEQLLKQYGLKKVDRLQLDRKSEQRPKL